MARARAPIWLTAPSRWTGLPRAHARAGLALLALLLGGFLLVLASPLPGSATRDPAAADSRTDVVLYRAIAADVRHGAPYYAAAASELRAGDYPLRPFVTFRLPTLALVQALLPHLLARALLYALAAATMLAWYMRLREGVARRPGQVVGLLFLAGGMAASVQPALEPFHEAWAGLLVALALAVRQPGRWLDAVAVAFVAMLVRETAALFAVIMAAAALVERRPREAFGWAAAVSMFLIVLILHARAVATVVRADDPASPGWLGLLGLGYFINAVTLSTALRLVPSWIAALLLGLSLFGWSSWRSPLAARALATLCGYVVLLSVFGRVDTFYWALLVAPLALVGLVFVPDGLRDLIAATLDRRRVIVTRRVA